MKEKKKVPWKGAFFFFFGNIAGFSDFSEEEKSLEKRERERERKREDDDDDEAVGDRRP